LSVISRLTIKHLRNLDNVSLELSPKINFFYGDNGSGKTSILEAVSLLGLGRSFRSHKTRSLVNHQQDDLLVFSDITSSNMVTVPIGIQKYRDGRSIIRMSGESIYSATLLAKQLPLQLINSSSFQLIEGSPNQRRQFLDWMVFHVKPEFSSYWKALQKTLKQRNSLLRRDKIDYSDLLPWDIELCRLADEIDLYRNEVFERFKQEFKKITNEFSTSVNLEEIELDYLKGWGRESTFSECLQEDFKRDRRDGYTHSGPQRADIKIRAKGKSAAEVLSRGQEKALICAMHIAQAYLYQIETGQKCVFLVDDLLAELDGEHSKELATWLTNLDGQVLVTGVSRKGLQEAWKDKNTNFALFHVKQGGVEAVDDKNLVE